MSEFAQRARAAWARLIRKVYEADPLECPQCKGPMRIIALIDDPGVVRRILAHRGLWAPKASERSPPIGHEAWPTYVSLPLTYHPVPDIASRSARIVAGLPPVPRAPRGPCAAAHSQCAHATGAAHRAISRENRPPARTGRANKLARPPRAAQYVIPGELIFLSVYEIGPSLLLRCGPLSPPRRPSAAVRRPGEMQPAVRHVPSVSGPHVRGRSSSTSGPSSISSTCPEFPSASSTCKCA